MSSTVLGTSLVRTGQELVYDPERGYITREVWRGTKSQLIALQSAFKASGLRSTVTDDEARPALQVDIPAEADGTDPEEPVEKWTFNKDYVQESLWSNKRIMDLVETHRAALTAAYGSPTNIYLFSDVLSQLRRECENALKGLRVDSVYSVVENGLPTGTVGYTYEVVNPGSTAPLTPAETKFSASVSTALLNIYKLLLLGADSYEIERLVVTRSRTFSINYASRVTMLETPRVYSTSAFFTAENVPSVIRTQLANMVDVSDWSKPDNAQWAWKVRQDRSEISSNGKVEEVRDWVFAPWSTLLYEYVS